MRRQRGFSLLEMVIVVAIIALLATIAFVAFGAVRRSQENRSTRATLEIARSMFNAYVTAGQSGGNSLQAKDAKGNAIGFMFRLAPPQWQFNAAAYQPNDPPDTVNFREKKVNGTNFQAHYEKTIDYYVVPRRENDAGATDDSASGLVIIATPVPMNAPLAEAGEAKKWVDPTSWQLVETMKTIRRLRGNPDAKAIWSTLRESQIVNVPDNAGKNLRQDFLIDAWGHPILFVPGSGLRGIRFGTGAPPTNPADITYLKGDMGSTPLEQQGLRSPDGRAFWVSAGPDGYFDTHDDNLYSFDN